MGGCREASGFGARGGGEVTLAAAAAAAAVLAVLPAMLPASAAAGGGTCSSEAKSSRPGMETRTVGWVPPPHGDDGCEAAGAGAGAGAGAAAAARCVSRVASSTDEGAAGPVLEVCWQRRAACRLAC